jgi:hypothetical protein
MQVQARGKGGQEGNREGLKKKFLLRALDSWTRDDLESCWKRRRLVPNTKVRENVRLLEATERSDVHFSADTLLSRHTADCIANPTDR